MFRNHYMDTQTKRNLLNEKRSSSPVLRSSRKVYDEPPYSNQRPHERLQPPADESATTTDQLKGKKYSVLKKKMDEKRIISRNTASEPEEANKLTDVEFARANLEPINVSQEESTEPNTKLSLKSLSNEDGKISKPNTLIEELPEFETSTMDEEKETHSEEDRAVVTESSNSPLTSFSVTSMAVESSKSSNSEDGCVVKNEEDSSTGKLDDNSAKQLTASNSTEDDSSKLDDRKDRKIRNKVSIIIISLYKLIVLIFICINAMIITCIYIIYDMELQLYNNEFILK